MNETGESFLNLHYRPLSVIHRSLHLGLIYGKKIKNKGGRAIEFFQSFAQLSPSLKLDMRVCHLQNGLRVDRPRRRFSLNRISAIFDRRYAVAGCAHGGTSLSCTLTVRFVVSPDFSHETRKLAIPEQKAESCFKERLEFND